MPCHLYFIATVGISVVFQSLCIIAALLIIMGARIFRAACV